MHNLYMLVALVTGAGIAAQAVINARLRLAVGGPLWAGAVQTFIGLTLILLVAIAVRQPVPIVEGLSRAPWWAWTGGLIGATYVVVTIVLVPHLGAALMLAAMIVGQLIAALLIDHYGWFGATTIPISPARVLGVVLLFAGVLLIRWR